MDGSSDVWKFTTAIVSSLAAPAFAAYYGKDTTNSLGLVLGVTGVATVMWGLIGYSMIYGVPLSTGVIGTSTYGTVNKVLNSVVPNGFSDVLFELNFALSTLAIIAGAVGHRFKKEWFVSYSLAALLLTYCPQAMWQWNGPTGVEGEGWAYKYGIRDAAGGLIVHLTAGIASLVLGLLAGNKPSVSGASPKATLLSTAAIALGCFALYAGKAGSQSLAILNTQHALAAGVVTQGLLEMVLPIGGAPFTGSASLLGAAKGAVIGLVSTSAGVNMIAPMWTILIGMVATLFVYLANYATALYGVKASGLDVFLTHGFGGAISVALTGLFADSAYGADVDGSFYYNAISLGKQCAGISYIVLMTTVSTALIFGFLWIVGRVVFQQEITAEDEVVAVPAAEPTAKAEPVVSA